MKNHSKSSNQKHALTKEKKLNATHAERRMKNEASMATLNHDALARKKPEYIKSHPAP
jgi:hypothetical protein